MSAPQLLSRPTLPGVVPECVVLLLLPRKCPGAFEKNKKRKRSKNSNAFWCGWTLFSSRFHRWTRNPNSANLVMEEVEGVWLGAAVTLFPVPMTVFDFPSELLKEGVGQKRVSVLPLPLLGLSDCLRTSHLYHAVILTTARLR